MKIKILFTSPNLNAGGAQRHLINIVNSIDYEIFEVTLVLYSRKGELLEDVNSNVRIISPSRNFFSDSFFTFNVLCGVVLTSRTIIAWKPDIMYSRHWCKIPNAILGKLFNVRSVSGEGNNLDATLFKQTIKIRIFYFLRWLGIRYSTAIVANSKSLCNELTDVFKPASGVEVIYNGVDISKIRLQSKEDEYHPWFDKKYPLIVSVGRLSEQKDHKTFIQALGIVNERSYVRAIIIGEGILMNSLTELSDKMGIKDRVDFIGNKSNPFPYIAKSDLFVCSSMYEGLSNVILEAMALGIPVISTNHKHGADELIQNGINGILVPVEDPEKMAEAIINLLNDKDLHINISNECKKRSEDFSLEKLGRNYENYFKQLMSA